MAGAWSSEDVQEAAENHVRKLARRLRIELHFTSDWEMWQAHPSTRQVWIPEITRPLLYLVALHELGHVASEVATSWSAQYDGDPGVQVLVEGAAWAWAVRAALPYLVAEMAGEDWTEMAALFLSYFRLAGQTYPKRGAVAI